MAATVVVTGATGTLGRAVVGRLQAEGHRVGVLTRRPFRAAEMLGADVAIHEWHPLSEPVPAAALEGASAVINLMGEPIAGAPRRGRDALVVSSRINATRRIAEAVGERRLRLVALSIAHAPRPAGEPLDEASASEAAPAGPAREVLAWEEEARKAAALGASLAIVRLGLLAAPEGPLAAMVGLARRGLFVNLKDRWVPAIALEDAAGMLAALANAPDIEGVIHGVAPTPVAGEALAGLLAAVNRLPARLPVPSGLVSRQLGFASLLLASSRPVAPQRLLEAGANFIVADPLPSLERCIAGIAADARARPHVLSGLLPARRNAPSRA